MSQTSNKLKINLFGENWKLKKVLLNIEVQLEWEKIATKLNKPLQDAMIDPFFYHYLNHKTIKSIDDVEGIEMQGLLNNSKNQIEIWYKGKKVKKLKLEDLNQEQYLFPLYNTEKSKISNQYNSGIYIEQKEIGYIGSYQFNLETFRIEHLKFKIAEINNQLILLNITYPNCISIFKKKDTLINYQNSFVK